ncbi:MAG: hypothetical protein J6W37_02455 [Bacteroidales bacterium]|nr:hypothetical protein [Bacteroidales bacterium]
MIAIVYIFNLISPIIFFVGLFGLAFQLQGEWGDEMWIYCGLSAVAGLLFGLKAWGYGVPPRWFWAKSQLDLFANRVSTVVGYMIQFFLLPLCVACIVEFFD